MQQLHQCGVAYIETDALVLGEAQHHDEVVHLNARALKLYLRAKGYCERAMEVRFPGIMQKLPADPVRALAKAEKKDVPLLYWMAASWGSAIALGVRTSSSTCRRCGRGAGHCARRNVEPGNAARDVRLARQPVAGARRQSRTGADALYQGGRTAEGPVAGAVALALGVAVPAQDRAEHEKLLKEALAIDPAKDPSNQLVTLVQQRARALLDQIDTEFPSDASLARLLNKE